MTIEEYNKVKDLKYLDYVVYLQKKYGMASEPYFVFSRTGEWVYIQTSTSKKFLMKNEKIRRLQDGLIIHHVAEDQHYNLSDKYKADLYSKVYQEPKLLCYCDLLEHLLLHILIFEFTQHKRKIPKHLISDVRWCIDGTYPNGDIHNSPATYTHQDLTKYKQAVIDNMDVVKLLLNRIKKDTN